MISIFVLLAVFIMIAVRRIGKYRLQIWQIMVGGAVAVLLTLQISPIAALRAINLDVILFLLGVFVIGQALEESGYLSYLSQRLLGKAKSLDLLLLLVLLGAGGLAALLMNDTLAIIGTPLMLMIARGNAASIRSPKLLLLALAFAITIGSVASPIGNPQNLLIAINGNIHNPFLTFLRYLLVPTLVNLALAYLILRLFYRRDFGRFPLKYEAATVSDPGLARLARVSLVVLVCLIIVKVILVLFSVPFDLRLTYIALAAASPIVLFSSKRLGVVKRIDWTTLVFFGAMFILMQSVWDSNFFQTIVTGTNRQLTSAGVILGASVGLSQFISNVPLVALYLPVLQHAGATTKALMALAAGSTIAGNFTILGAASNVIIIQNAEKKGRETLTFWEFVRIGVPLTALNVAVYAAFLALLPS